MFPGASASTQPQTDDVRAYFIEPIDPGDDESAKLARAVRRLEVVFNRTGAFQLAGTQEMEVVYSDCAEDIGISPEEQRECQLSAARRSFIDWYVVLRVEVLDASMMDVVLEVWDPDENRRVIVEACELPRTAAITDVRAAVEQLACTALRHPAVLDVVEELPEQCQVARARAGVMSPTSTVVQGAIEIVATSPRAVDVSIDGEPVGVAPGQFLVRPGQHEVTIGATGHGSITEVVTVTAGEITTLSGLELEAHRATLEIVANVGEARILVDGEELGTTVAGETVRVDVSPDAEELVVELSGYSRFSAPLRAVSGTTSRVEIRLERTICGNGTIEDGEQCDDGNTDAGDGCSASCVAEAPDGFVRIPAGTFIMGSSVTEEGRGRHEPQHRVTISHDFYLQATEVTLAQWADVFDFEPESDCLDCAVAPVPYARAVEYVNALSEREGLPQCYVGLDFVGFECTGYRLPSESEWEYAARAGHEGARYGELDEIAWYEENSGARRHPVAQKEPNVWGLYDMLGNVWEWCMDYNRPYPEGHVIDPLLSERGGLGYRVVRGGGYDSGADSLRAANRNGYMDASTPPNLGMRVARTILPD